MLKPALNSASLMLCLVNNLKDFNHILGDKFKLNITKFDV